MKKIVLGFLLGLIAGQLLGQDVKSDSTYCDFSNLHSVNDMLLKKKLGDHQLPEQNPKYEGGLEGLKSFFGENSLADIRAQSIVFRVHIGFVVNCRGEAKGFEIISEGKGDLKDLGEQVLKVAKQIPGKWTPASAKGHNVDCNQVLSFTVASGKLDKLTYR
ncbi:MAG TPA: hypothetical protein VEW65_07530 [Chryseolinea sp.]|nr:hypothetical protein [Chryseolinea sp.]